MSQFPVAEEVFTLLSQDVADGFRHAAEHMMLPHVTMRPHIYRNGSEWIAQYGDVAASGATPQEACLEFDAYWTGAKKATEAA